ncbi:MAG: hypothetical protein MZV64_31450 [Ignavibacteriales bacterium]|nr:hypothetical protein [Ignavibacteriales bacterium]
MSHQDFVALYSRRCRARQLRPRPDRRRSGCRCARRVTRGTSRFADFFVILNYTIYNTGDRYARLGAMSGLRG